MHLVAVILFSYENSIVSQDTKWLVSFIQGENDVIT